MSDIEDRYEWPDAYVPRAELDSAQARIAELERQAAAMREALTWIAQQFCGRSDGDDCATGLRGGHCHDSGDCLTEYCLSCYAAVKLMDGTAGRALLDELAELRAYKAAHQDVLKEIADACAAANNSTKGNP